jgi:hypothetical protein
LATSVHKYSKIGAFCTLFCTYNMRYGEKEYQSEYYKLCLGLASDQIRLFISNNVYLLKTAQKSFKQQMREFKERGIKISETYYYNLSKGHRQTCSLTYLNFFCEYWGISLVDMLSRNFEQEDKDSRIV